MEYISFPGLGIEPFHMNPVAFNLFGHPVMWYGIIIACGMVLAFFYALSRAKIEKIKSDDIIDLGIFLIIFGVIGARLYYVFFSGDKSYFQGNVLQVLKNIVSIWNGGLAIYGGIIAGFITMYFVAKYKKMRFSTLLDVTAPAVMVGQIVGRWGNFVNVEAYGSETASFIRMGIHKTVAEGGEFYFEKFYHPTFLYESVWNLIGLVLITIFYKKKKFNGQVFYFYMSWYGFGRMFIEGLRTDSLYVGSVRVSQLVAAVTFVVGVVLMIVNLIMVKRYNSELAPDDSDVASENEETDLENCIYETNETTDDGAETKTVDITPEEENENGEDN